MIIISNNALKYFDNLPKNLVVRVNTAWVNTVKELEILLENSTNSIYLDYAKGRTKYPRPKIKLKSLIKLANKMPRVDYFAISNSENPNKLSSIANELNPRIIIVPKIESIKGIKNLKSICKAARTKIIMLDKEDLYTSLKNNDRSFRVWFNRLNKKAKENNIKILRLQGVIFDYDF